MSSTSENSKQAEQTVAFPIGRAALATPRFTPPSSYWLEHIPFAFWLMEQARPKVYVELGVHTGGSYCNFCQAVQDLKLDCRCYGIDNFEGDPHYQKYGEDVLSNLKSYHDPIYSGFSTLIKSDFDSAVDQFDHGSIDVLHIDGTHFYDDVKKDFNNWLPKMSPVGIVIFHDTNVHERDFGVFKIWAELRERYDGFEFYHCNGLGILGISQSPSQAIDSLFRADESEALFIREYFSSLGGKCSAIAENQSKIERIQDLEAQGDQLRVWLDDAKPKLKLFEQLAELSETKSKDLHAAQNEAELARNDALDSKNEAERVREEAKALYSEIEVSRSEILELQQHLKVSESRSAAAFDRFSIVIEELRKESDDKSTLLDKRQELATNLERKLSESITKRNDLDYHARQAEKRAEEAAKDERIIRNLLSSESQKSTVAARAMELHQIRNSAVRRLLATGDRKGVRNTRTIISMLRSSGLFDIDFYCSQFPNERFIDGPLSHYVSCGRFSGAKPNILFDPFCTQLSMISHFRSNRYPTTLKMDNLWGGVRTHCLILNST